MKRKTSLNLVLASIAVAIALITAAAFLVLSQPLRSDHPTYPYRLFTIHYPTRPTIPENRPICAQPNRQDPAL